MTRKLSMTVQGWLPHVPVLVLWVATALVAMGGCQGGAMGQPDAAATGAPGPGAALRETYRRPQAIPHPTSNPYSDARRDLGHKLFFEPRLSSSGLVSCATCHNPSLGWGDGLSLSVDDQRKVKTRRSPTILNLAWSPLVYWDGRANSLEAQVVSAFRLGGSLNTSTDGAVGVLKRTPPYEALFAQAYPGEGITPQTIAKAIALFERTVVSPPAPFDRWLEGNEAAISEPAKRGFRLFNTKARCAACHGTWRFTDDSFHDIGTAGEDRGRGQHLQRVAILQFAFKTPTLRDVTLRAPYMHNGSLKTLAAVIDHYNAGGAVKRESLSREISPLGLTPQEKTELEAFLETLTSQEVLVQMPVLPR